MPDSVTDNTPLRERIARRKRELERAMESTIVLPVPRFEDVVSVQYRPLSYRQMWRIESRHERRRDEAERVLRTAVDKLLAACERLVEPVGPDTYRETGYRWGPEAARDLFGCDLPEDATAQQALMAIFGGDEELLVQHATDYEEQRRAARGAAG